MAVRYIQSDDDSAAALTAGQVDDGADSWWAGAQLGFARVALATALAASTASAAIARNVQQDLEDVPAGKLYGQPDEDFWASPLSPTSIGNYVKLPYLPDLNDDPASKLYGQPDEDFWSPYAGASGDGQPYIAQLAQASLALFQRLPYLPDPEEIPAGKLYGQPDEDFWENPVNLISTTNYVKLPYLPELSDDPAGKLYGQPDEDFWDNLFNPISITNYIKLPYLPDPSDEIVPPVVFQPEEDFWVNPVAPVAPAIYQRLPYLPELSDEPAGSLHGQPDEDFWDNPFNPISTTNFLRLPYLPEPTDDPAGSLSGQPDEDFWINPVAPVAAAIFQRLPYLPELSDEPADSLYGVPEETDWQSPGPAGPGQNRVAPTAASVFQSLPYGFDAAETIPPPAVFQPEEDFWSPYAGASGDGQPYVAQLAQSSLALYQRLPYLPDLSDDPAASLRGVPEETEWASPGPAGLGQSWVAPVPAQFFQALPYGFDAAETIPPPAAFQPDEDYWQSPASTYVAPTSRPTSAPPIQGDLEEIPAGSLRSVPEETEWASPGPAGPGQSWVAPVPARFFQALPYGFDAAEIFLPPPFRPEEDLWQNPVPSWAAQTWASIFTPPVPPPGIYGFDEFTSYWWTEHWTVRTHSLARSRISHSAARSRTSRGVSRKSKWQ